MENKSIAIIGGGFTGLSAAYELSKNKNFTITLYEAGANLGGLAGGFALEGTSIEKAYHHLFKTDRDIIGLISELGISGKLIWHDSSVATYYGGELYPFNSPIDLLRFKPLAFWNRLRLGIVLLYLQKTGNWSKFVHVSAYDWMERWCGREVMRVVWGPLLKGKFSKYYKDISMAWLWARIHTRASSQAEGGEKLGYIDGGFDFLTRTLAKKLIERGVTLKTQTPVESIKEAAGGRVSLTVGGQAELYDKVIVTLPSQVFDKLISGSSTSPAYLKKLESIDYLGAVLSVFTSSQKISDYYWHNINDIKAPFLVFLNHTNLIPRSRYGGKYVYYIGTYVPHDHEYFSMDQESIEKLWFDYLKKMFPDFNPEKITEKHLFKLKFAQHVVGLDYQAKIPSYETPVKGVYLANFSQIFPEDRGTNYAVREGRKIARMIADPDQSL